MARRTFPLQDGALFLAVSYLHNWILELRRCREVLARYRRQAESDTGAVVYLVRGTAPQSPILEVDVATLAEMILRGEVQGDWRIKRYSGLATERYSDAGWQSLADYMDTKHPE